MSDLKIRFVKFEKVLAMQVLDQSERIFEFLRKSNFKASNGFKITISVSPQILGLSELWLRGCSTSHHLLVSYMEFNTNIDRDFHLGKILCALEEFKAALNKEEKPEETKDYFVFEI